MKRLWQERTTHDNARVQFLRSGEVLFERHEGNEHPVMRTRVPALVPLCACGRCSYMACIPTLYSATLKGMIQSSDIPCRIGARAPCEFAFFTYKGALR